MTAVDTSSLMAFLQGELASDVDAVANALADEILIMPPFVLTELFSARNIPEGVLETVAALPTRPILDGFWRRAGEMRRAVLALKVKARTLDSLIAAFCLDHDLVLITRDRDFRHFANEFGLKLITHTP